MTVINRIGKRLYFVFGESHTLSIQFMLYGAMHWYEGKNENKFTIATLDFADGTGLAITNWQKAVILTLNPEISTVPDAMELPEGYLQTALEQIAKPIKTVLQEGKVVQGIGNAYVNEILYAVKLSPFSIAAKIPEGKIKLLEKAIPEVLTDAEEHIRKNFPNTITEKDRDLLKQDYDSFQKKLPSFAHHYQAWYSEAVTFLRLLLPDRVADFTRLYETPKMRKDVRPHNYVIEDYLRNITITTGFDKKVVVGPDAAIPLMQQQLQILDAVKITFESTFYDIQLHLQADLLDRDLSAAAQLARNKQYRGAGVLTRVVLVNIWRSSPVSTR